MSFRVDLWNGLNVIKTQFTSTFDKMSNLCDILLYYANYQKSYSKNLESLYKDNKDLIKDDYLLDKGILELINNFKLESEYHKVHYKYIKKKIIVSIKEIIEKEKISFNSIFNEGIQIQENFSKIKNNLINKQKAYNISLKDFYNFISNLDENEMKYILENENLSNDNLSSNRDNDINRITAMSQSEIKINNIISIDNKINKQQLSKKEKLIDKISEYKNEYTTALNESNEYLKSYRTTFENVLQSLEEKYKLLIDTLHSSLISTMDQRMQLINKLSLLYTNFLENNVKKILIKKEIIEFIIRNVTKEFPINKFEFISNKFEDKKLNLDINKYINDNIGNEASMYPEQRRGKSRKKTEVRNFRRRSIKKKNTGDKNENAAMLLENNSIFTDIKNYKIKSNIYLIDDFVDELITNRGEEEKINIDNIYYNDSSSKMIDISNIKTLIDKKNNECIIYVENLIKSINNKRAKGNFLINKKSYDAFIDIFKFLLDNYPTSDFILKNIIILSQTFYIFEIVKDYETNSNKKKIFLQNGLKNYPIFNKDETWHRVINFTLSNNVFNKDISQSINKNEIYNKLKVLSYNTLISYLTDLKYFTDDENIFNEIKSFYVRIYELDEESINKEVKDIINYEPIKQRKKGVSFSLKTIQKTNKKQESFNENKES